MLGEVSGSSRKKLERVGETVTSWGISLERLQIFIVVLLYVTYSCQPEKKFTSQYLLLFCSVVFRVLSIYGEFLC